MELQTLKEVRAELKRFEKRLKAAEERISNDKSFSYNGCKETGALKRAALDLKNELTRITNKTAI